MKKKPADSKYTVTTTITRGAEKIRSNSTSTNSVILAEWHSTPEAHLQTNAMRFLPYLGGDINHPSTMETPKRWAKMMLELTRGHDFNFTVFPNEKNYDEMVVQKDIAFYSLCEHHLIPFFGTAAIAYVPGRKLVGLSKLGHTVQDFSRRLQVQERMTNQIAIYLMDRLKPKGVAVVLKARHLCMEMRGIQKIGAETTTSCLKGVFLKKPECRKEFLDLIR